MNRNNHKSCKVLCVCDSTFSAIDNYLSVSNYACRRYLIFIYVFINIYIFLKFEIRFKFNEKKSKI